MDSEVLMVLGLAKAGYGTINELRLMPAQWVLDAVEHMQFASEYEETTHEINRSKP